MQAISAGQYKKAQYAITKGVEFVQIDLESISEFQEPDLETNMERIRRLGIRYGLHAETPAFGGRELPHLDSAIDIDYERGHRRLLIVLEEAGKLKYEYVLMHSSESTPFLLLGKDLQPTDLVDPWGRSLEDFIFEQGGSEDFDKNWILNWLWENNQHYIWIDIMGQTPAAMIREAQEERKLHLSQQRELYLVERKGQVSEEKEATLSQEEKDKINLSQEEEDTVKRQVKKLLRFELKNRFMQHIKSKSLHYGPERTAYYIIAKWMEVNNDPLWEDIIEKSIEYYAKADGKTKDEWLEDKKIEKVNGKWSIENEKFRLEYRLWVASVSAKYIWGHFSQDKCPDKNWKRYDDPKEIIEDYDYKIPFLFETPMASTGLEEYLRFPNPVQMYYLVKEIGFDYTGLAIDIEHMLMCNLNVELSFDLLPEDAGKYVRVVHVGWPSALGPAHIPLPLGSEQQMYLYKMYYKLRQKGFGKNNKDYYIIFERGGGADPIQQSILAIRKIVEFLEKDIDPGELISHPEFFGVQVGQIASYQRQREVIEEHGRDPLKGLITTPEEDHTLLGRGAIEKGKRPEEWKKEEHR